MKHLPVTILVVLAVLGAMVSGCDGTPHYDSRLTAADSLMRSAPDSALAMVEAVDRDSLTNEADRAYRDLLLTQARYKAYVTATSDSDINRALAWYRAHPAEREKLTRAYIYKGAVMEELNHPDSAMLYYKTAETTAAPDDYFNLGYSNLRIGDLYRSIYYNDSAVVSRMKKAARYFTAAQDSDYLIISIGTQGLYDQIVGKDSAICFLEQSILIGKENSTPYRFYFQSKLAGTYFYDQDYQRAKDLAIDIIANGRNDSKEHAFYYYAARSYIKLNLIDSALWVKSLIPSPVDAVDSMNWHLLLGELSQVANNYQNYAYHMHEADMIDKRITESSMEAKLSNAEIEFDAHQRETKLKEDNHFNIIMLILAFAFLISCGAFLLKKINQRYKKQLEEVQKELKELIDETERKVLDLESERDEHQIKLAQTSHELVETNKRLQSSISSQVSDIVRYRNAALNELLYQNIRIKTVSQDGRKRYLPFVSLIKDLSEKREILHTPPKKTFWNKLKLSVDGEYNGIVTFVEEHYPELSSRERQLFLLMCAGFSNQIIRICMDYTSDATASNNKKRLLKKMGLNMKLEEFIQSYIENRPH